jgi:hypothetical protein
MRCRWRRASRSPSDDKFVDFQTADPQIAHRHPVYGEKSNGQCTNGERARGQRSNR